MPGAPLLPALLLAGALAILWRVVRGGSARRSRPIADERQRRRATYTGSATQAAGAFLVPSVVGLALLGRLDALWVLPPEFGSLAGWVGPLQLSDAVLFGAGIAGGSLGALVGALWAVRRGKRGIGGPMLGEVGTLLPRDRGELPYAAALAIAAGVTEEPFFRLLLPLLLTLVTGSAVAAIGIAALLFGLAHRYQGRAGMAATTVTALLFTALYLASGRLWVAMAFHVLVNVMALVVRPALTGAWRSRDPGPNSSAASRCGISRRLRQGTRPGTAP